MKVRIIAAAVLVAIAAWAGYVSFRPAPTPHVRFATLGGGTLSTADLRGKVVLVNFWATWCTSCIKEMPKMAETYRKYSPRGYEVVAVAVQSDSPKQVDQFVQKRALPFKVALDTSGEAARTFGDVRVTPVSVLLDREGRVVRRWVGEPDWADLHAEVEKALGG